MKHFKYLTIMKGAVVSCVERLSLYDLENDFINKRQGGCDYTDHDFMDLIEKKHNAFNYTENMEYEQFMSEDYIELPSLAVTDEVSRYAVIVTFKKCGVIKTFVFSDVDFVHKNLADCVLEGINGNYFISDYEERKEDDCTDESGKTCDY